MPLFSRRCEEGIQRGQYRGAQGQTMQQLLTVSLHFAGLCLCSKWVLWRARTWVGGKETDVISNTQHIWGPDYVIQRVKLASVRCTGKVSRGADGAAGTGQ